MYSKARTAIVTGAGGHIGSATAALLASQGATVIVADSNTEAANHTAIHIQSLGHSAVSLTFDLREEAEVESMIEEVLTKFGRIDLLVNNAAAQAFATDHSVETMDTAVWDQAFAVNARGTMLCCKYALRAMSQREQGCIINIASNLALQGHVVQAAYSSSKAAILQLTRSIAASHGRLGIRCNAISPGLIASGAGDSPIPEKLRNAIVAETLNGRLGQAQEIAEAIAFLASDAAKHITGQNLVVDGGNSSHVPGLAHFAGIDP